MQGLVKLFASTAELGLPAASAAAARKWVTAAQAMMQQWAAFVEDFLGKLALCEHTTQELVQTGFQELQETVSQSTQSHAIYAFASYIPAIQLTHYCSYCQCHCVQQHSTYSAQHPTSVLVLVSMHAGSCMWGLPRN